MCGIAGYIPTERESNYGLVKQMCDTLEHRGPDGYGFFHSEHIALGHRRLAIIDLAGGDQPICNEDGSVQVVFNGEIYNFAELRRDLERKGHRFRTQSDTEVLVHLYEDVGERTPEFLNGMFAFAIWDSRARELFLARDRMGEKPLYYAEHCASTRFCFASELKAIAAMPEFHGCIRQSAVADFLCLSYIPGPSTIYEGVYKLPPAHSLKVGAGGVRLRRYWTPDFSACFCRNSENAEEMVRELCGDAVRLRLLSDVPLGAFLSGGVDSSSVVALMSRNSASAVRTFSIGFENRNFNELPFARIVAERYATDHREEVVTPRIHEVLESLVQAFDEPFGDSSAVPMMYLSRMTRRHVTVALSGDGADEIFGGYRRYRFGVFEQRLRERFPEWFRQSAFGVAGRIYPKFDFLPRVFRAKSLLSNLAREMGDAYFHSMSAFNDDALASILPGGARKQTADRSTREWFGMLFANRSHLEPLQQMQSVDFETYLPDDILVKTDRTTMAYSLEGRAPLLDHRLVEMACSIPPSLHLAGGEGKRVFKRAMAPLLPDQLLTRRKMGFSVPLASWLRGVLRPLFESVVRRPAMEQFISMDGVDRLWREHQSGLCNHDRKLWNILMLACWESRHRPQSGGSVMPEAVDRLRLETVSV